MFKINIRPQDCKFYVNKDKRKVVCVYSDSQWLLYKYLWQNCNWYHGVNSRVEMPKRFIGVATCAENDEWNEELGKRLAFHRMKDKLHRSFFRRANNYVNMLDRELNKLMSGLNLYGEALTKSMAYRERELHDQVSHS